MKRHKHDSQESLRVLPRDCLVQNRETGQRAGAPPLSTSPGWKLSVHQAYLVLLLLTSVAVLWEGSLQGLKTCFSPTP